MESAGSAGVHAEHGARAGGVASAFVRVCERRAEWLARIVGGRVALPLDEKLPDRPHLRPLPLAGAQLHEALGDEPLHLVHASRSGHLVRAAPAAHRHRDRLGGGGASALLHLALVLAALSRRRRRRRLLPLRRGRHGLRPNVCCATPVRPVQANPIVSSATQLHAFARRRDGPRRLSTMIIARRRGGPRTVLVRRRGGSRGLALVAALGSSVSSGALLGARRTELGARNAHLHAEHRRGAVRAAVLQPLGVEPLGVVLAAVLAHGVGRPIASRALPALVRYDQIH